MINSESDFFWKNFRLGTELQVSGSFLYNALYSLKNMKTFYYEEECFEFLYNTAVGLERLEKIVIILLEHADMVNQEEFEKRLITHNHIELLNRIKAHKNINLGKTHMKFLLLIRDFYKSARYDRYNISSANEENKDKKALIEFISSQLEIEIRAEISFSTPIDNRIRKFIGKTLIKITSTLYQIIVEESERLNIYTNEVTYDSKAYKIFMMNDTSFEKEEAFKKEILLFLLKKQDDNTFYKHIEQISPLKLEHYSNSDYVSYLLNFQTKSFMLNELEYILETEKFDKERYEKISQIDEIV